MEHGWKADCEVTYPNGRECDVLLWAPDRLNYAVELETNPQDGIQREKLNHYVHTNNVIDEMILVDITETPNNLDDVEMWLNEELHLW